MSGVSENVAAIFQARRAKAYALCLAYAGEAVAQFRWMQLGAKKGYYWTNRTYEAAQDVFGNAYDTGDALGWFLAHAKIYGVYLEIANDRKNAAIKPTVEKLVKRFKADLKEIFA